jgi:hypothetical protein
MLSNLFVELVELEGITVLSKELNADPLVIYLEESARHPHSRLCREPDAPHLVGLLKLCTFFSQVAPKITEDEVGRRSAVELGLTSAAITLEPAEFELHLLIIVNLSRTIASLDRFPSFLLLLGSFSPLFVPFLLNLIVDLAFTISELLLNFIRGRTRCSHPRMSQNLID